jgi:hypothetical protein
VVIIQYDTVGSYSTVVHIMDVDAASNHSKDPHKVLNNHKWEEKKKYLKACLEQEIRAHPKAIRIVDRKIVNVDVMLPVCNYLVSS